MLLVPPSAFGLQVPIRGIVPVYARTGSVNPDKGARGIISREWVAKIGERERPVSYPDDFHPTGKNSWLLMIGDSCYRIHPNCEYARTMRKSLNAPPLPPTDLQNQKGNLAVDFQAALCAVPKVLYHAPSERDEEAIKRGKIPFKPAPLLRKHSDRQEGKSDNIIGREKSEHGDKDIVLNMARIFQFSAFCMSKTSEGANGTGSLRNDRNVYEVNTKAFVTCAFESLKNLKSLEEIQVSEFTNRLDGKPDGKPYRGCIGITMYLREVEYYDEHDPKQSEVQNFGQRKHSRFSSEKEVRLILIFWPDEENGKIFLPVGLPHIPFDFASCFRQIGNDKNRAN